MDSSTRPQRRSRTTSRTGARPWCTPSPRIAVPTWAAIRSISCGSNEAPQHSGDGYTVACQASIPVRHSSCTMAGMPNRPAATIWSWSTATARAPSAGATGAVPNTRVSWPRPASMRVSQSGTGAASCWCGTTSPRAESTPTQTL